MSHIRLLGAFLFLVTVPLSAPGQSLSPIVEHHEGDDYTRYELLRPDTASFRIVYEVTATAPRRALLLQRHPQGQ